MSTKRLSLTVFAVLSMLVFTFTSVGAQGGTPGGELEVPDFSDFTPLPDDYVPAEGIGADIVTPSPISPSGQIIFTKTPKFYFTRNSSATQYRITLTDLVATPDVVVYAYTGAGSCGTSYCWLQPPTALKTLQYNASSGGLYTWTVEAMVGGIWQAPSSLALFLVGSKGFTSTFDVNTKKWLPVTGSWTRTTKGYYKTNGLYLNGSSSMHKELFFDGLVYEVKMKRKYDTSGPNRVIISGTPSPLFSSNWWDDSYVFQYDNEGYWSVYKSVNGVISSVSTWVYSPFIELYGWNTLTVWRTSEDLHFWVNGVYLGNVADTSHHTGYVGLGMYQAVNGAAPLLVDYAKTYYAAVWPFAVPLTESGEVDPAYELTADPAADFNPDSSR